MICNLGERQVQFASDSYYIAANATVIGSVFMGHNSSIWFNAVVRADNDRITIGERSNIQDGAVLHVDPGIPLTLGNNVTVGHMAMLHGCSVGDNSLIGINAVVLNHAVIGENCLIGANSLITEGKKIPANSLVMGSPAKVIHSLTDDELQRLNQAAQVYVDKIQRYRTALHEL